MKKVIDKKKTTKVEGEEAVLAKIAAMPEPYRSMGKKVHTIIKVNAPSLLPRVWYGMPGYADKSGTCVIYFRGGQMFKERWMTLGFNNKAKLDNGVMWPIVYAITKLTPTQEKKIAGLVKKAVS